MEACTKFAAGSGEPALRGGTKDGTELLGRLWHELLRETLNKLSAAVAESFLPILRFGKLEIHKVFLRFPNLDLTKNLSPTILADFFRASLEI